MNEWRDFQLYGIYLYVFPISSNYCNAPEEQGFLLDLLEIVAGAASMLSFAARIIRACLFNRMSMNV